MIPKVKTWRVTYYYMTSKPIVNGIRRHTVASCLVSTINKRFAKWLARDVIGYPMQYTPESGDIVFVRVGLLRKGKKI